MIDHEERLIKVYVLGSKFFISQKQSIPYKKRENMDVSYFFFDSQKPFEELTVLKDKLNFTEANDINIEIILIVSKYIRELANITIYGMDLVRDKKTGDYFILDLNYFPDFSVISNFAELLREHIWNTYQEWKKIQELREKKSIDMII